jgi:putative DNA primase/helicase
MRLNNWTFRRAAQQVDQIVARVVTSPEQPEGGAADPSIRLNRLWQRSVAVTVGDRVHDYLQSRGLELPIATGVLRFCASCRNPDGSRHPAMLAMVTDPEGHPVTIHRTFLGPSGKADVAAPRALMPGQVPHGSAVRLAPFADRLGVAEGIETALAATAQFGIPTWSALNANLLKQWEPPSSVREVVIFGDADVSFTGQAAAYALANRLVNKLRVDVKIPSSLGCDWADVA